MPELQFRPAVRNAAPLLIAIAAVSGGGKTYTALVLAAGLVGSNGKVGMLDTENGRGEMYADSPGIMKALPQGFSYLGMDPDYSPARFIDYLKAAEKAGIEALIVDSFTHEWEGIGGCCEIAEKNKLGGMDNWSLAKREHKRLVNYLLTTKMHLIFCLRAREKIKIDKKLPKNEQIVPLGLQPIAEKNFVFEVLLSIQLEEHTHFARAIKIPEGLAEMFSKERMLTKEDGARIAAWNATGSTKHAEAEVIRRLQVRAAEAADNGMDAYKAFFTEIGEDGRKRLEKHHEDNKKVAAAADKKEPNDPKGDSSNNAAAE
jgi:hypothetical protein